MIRRLNISILLLLGLWGFSCEDLFALASLEESENTAFTASVHELIGCESCHLPGKPDKISRAVLPQICGDCHPKQHQEFTESVHWSGKGAVCIDCHGSHDIRLVRKPESKAYRSLVCGTCHLGPKEHFDLGPHKAGMEKTGVLACASCHGNHSIQSPTLEIVSSACAGCHPKDTPEFQMGQEVGGLFTGIRDTLSLAAARLSDLQDQGISIRKEEQILEDARGAFTRARLVWHGLDMVNIRAEVSNTGETTQSLLNAISSVLDDRRLRKIGLVVVWGIILANIILLLLKKKNLGRS
jgi:formate-dependent nitrite reductase cytochrome c552 subunit